MQMIEVPAGLNGVVAAETAIGAVNGDEGYFHYGAHDATRLARENTLEEVWFLVREGRLPTPTELTRFRADVAALRSVARRAAADHRRGGAHRRAAARAAPFGPVGRRADPRPRPRDRHRARGPP